MHFIYLIWIISLVANYITFTNTPNDYSRIPHYISSIVDDDYPELTAPSTSSIESNNPFSYYTNYISNKGSDISSLSDLFTLNTIVPVLPLVIASTTDKSELNQQSEISYQSSGYPPALEEAIDDLHSHFKSDLHKEDINDNKDSYRHSNNDNNFNNQKHYSKNNRHKSGDNNKVYTEYTYKDNRDSSDQSSDTEYSDPANNTTETVYEDIMESQSSASTSGKKSNPSNSREDSLTTLPTSWRNINDNQRQFTLAFTAKSLIGDLVGRNLNIAPVLGVERSSDLLYKILYLASRGEALLKTKTLINESALIISIANCFAPNINEQFLDEPSSRARFRLECYSLIANSEKSLQLFSDVAEKYNAIPSNHAMKHTEFKDFPTWESLIAMSADKADTISAYQWMRLLIWLSENITSPILTQINMVIHAKAILCLAKRGTISERKLERLNESFVTEHNIQLNLTTTEVNMIYSAFKLTINENNAEEIFKEWITDLGTSSLRLTITLEQASFAGLTALIVIKEALKAYKDFNWAKIYELMPLEFDNAVKALLVVGDNAFYGYKQDLGIVKSTLYKSVSYVSKELLRNYGGPTYGTINHYMGWTKNPSFKTIIDQMILDYQVNTNITIDSTVPTATMDAYSKLMRKLDESRL